MRPERQISGVLKHKKRFKPKSPSTRVIKHAVIRNFFIRWIFLKETCNSHLGDSPSIFPSSSFHLQEFKQLQRALGEHLEQYWKDSKIESKCLLGQFVLSLTFVVHLLQKISVLAERSHVQTCWCGQLPTQSAFTISRLRSESNLS